MFQSTYYIDKTSNTFADNLAAFGLAYVLYQIGHEHGVSVRLEDGGHVFRVVCKPALKAEWVNSCRFFAGAPLLITIKNGEKLVEGTELNANQLIPDRDTAVDYEEEKRVQAEYYEQLKLLRKEAKRGERISEDRLPERKPYEHWAIMRAINPAALKGYNRLMAEWKRAEDRVLFPELLKILLAMTAQTPNDTDDAEAAWAKLGKEHGWPKQKATTFQLLNPSQGTGYNSGKTELGSRKNMPSCWILEWLKATGLFYGGVTRLVVNDPKKKASEDKDRKTYALIPKNLEWSQHTVVMRDFRRAISSMARKDAMAVKLDVLALLRYTQAFLKYFETIRESSLWGKPPADLVSGMQSAFFKQQKSLVLLNIGSLNLPLWIHPASSASLLRFQAALDEHIQIVQSLDETRGEQFGLLMDYRDFFSGDDLTPFFKFTAAYSGFIISQRERKKFVRPFTTTTLEVLFMNSTDKQYADIVKNEGFRRIAYAIRHSTIKPQSFKGMGGKPAVGIRYGLGQQLARKAAYPDEFLAELGEFMHLYNAENAQLREKERNPFRKDIRTTDIEAITALIDQYGAKVICNLLVAYGYATAPKDAPKSVSAEENDEPDDSDLGGDDSDNEDDN